MSYFDDQHGGDASDNDKDKGDDDESDVSETETNIEEEDEDEEEDVDAVDDDDADDDARAKGPDDEDSYDEAEDDKKLDFKKKYGISFGSNDDEDLIAFARKNKEKLKARYGEDFGEDEEEDLKNFARKYLKEKEEAEEVEEADDSETDESHIASKKKTKTKKLPASKQKAAAKAAVYDEEDDEDPTGEAYLQKFDKEINDNYLINFHPESAVHNYDEILAMTKITRDSSGIIVDDLHKTIPFLTKYERARILGQRAKHINSGASVFVKVPEKVIDGYLIAELELQEKRIPFIIRRPMPNGGSEYWSVKDLENIAFN